MNAFIRKHTVTVSLSIIAWAFCFCSFGQYGSGMAIRDALFRIEEDAIPPAQKFQQVLILKNEFQRLGIPKDSVYARILHRLGQLEYASNTNIATKDAIDFTAAAISINKLGKVGCSLAACINSYTNLANFYRSLEVYDVAARYYDSAILLRRTFNVPLITEVQLLLDKGQMLYNSGDYPKAIEAFTIGILKARAEKDSSLLPGLLNQRAQSYLKRRFFEAASKDVGAAGAISRIMKDSVELVNGMFIEADLHSMTSRFSAALLSYKNGIKARLQTGDEGQIADDYLNLGYFYLTTLHSYDDAAKCFTKAIHHARNVNAFEKLARAHINLEAASFYRDDYDKAEYYYRESLKELKLPVSRDISENPSSKQLGFVGNKELVLVIFENKAHLLLNRFKKTGKSAYLSACLQTLLLTDTLITTIRHEQLGEQSKLYWRERTREFFTHAMEACWLAKDSRLAFYFMEKSRAVVLLDKLSELGASAHLPESEARKQRDLQMAVIYEQQKLSSYAGRDNEYDVQQARLSEARANLEHYIKKLENTYSAYYQYKYANAVPTLDLLQKQLIANKQSFIEYFINDTIAYILGITPSGTRFLQLAGGSFDSRQLATFLRLCAREPTLNREYALFSSLSHSLYLLLFEPLKVPKGRVIISSDNFLIPFEALLSGDQAGQYLIYDYIFSYVYSAQFLLRKHPSTRATGDFIGFAPVSFKAYANVADLKPSGRALAQSAGHYDNSLLCVGDQATRNRFMTGISGYRVVNVFSHALADTTENEPVLFMQDSVIHLSELQLIDSPSTQLVVLSACQTNVGQHAKGEGIFSLARGFTSAGIPSVAATLWKADENAIYAISARFHEYLSKGIPKDEALQRSKLFFMQRGDPDRSFPFYWANMVLLGNHEPISLLQHNYARTWLALCFIVIVIAVTLRILRYRWK